MADCPPELHQWWQCPAPVISDHKPMDSEPVSNRYKLDAQPMGSVQGNAKLLQNSGVADGAQDHGNGSEA